ncbi:hypothetical protein CRG98_007510 [Punica granatum]|uniref:Uncharacterized protein n=1 Tax=Punica granatum TaxID=22663 RepID=A0A2I0KUU8_PUNGR|nr:hypothetical protein CRG98_007510 [Punica granatum]
MLSSITESLHQSEISAVAPSEIAGDMSSERGLDDCGVAVAVARLRMQGRCCGVKPRLRSEKGLEGRAGVEVTRVRSKTLSVVARKGRRWRLDLLEPRRI